MHQRIHIGEKDPVAHTYREITGGEDNVGFARARRTYQYKIKDIINPLKFSKGIELLSCDALLKIGVKFVEALVCGKPSLPYSLSLSLSVTLINLRPQQLKDEVFA